MAGYLGLDDGSDISGSLQGLQDIAAKQLQQEQNDKKPRPTANLYEQSQRQEQGFADTAPGGYYNSSLDLKNMDPKYKNDPNFYNGYMKMKGFQMQEAQQGMEQESLGWKRTDRDKARMISDGMATAAGKGGYEGVIDYLKGVDPEKAIAFTKEKLDLDKSIMQNDMYKFMTPIEKEKALVDGYGSLGKLGMALAKAPPGQQQAMYDLMKPMVKAINPNAPDDVAHTLPMFMLSAYQAIPNNQLFKYNDGIQQAESNVGKINNDIQRRINAGADPQTDPALQSLIAQRDQYKTKGEQNALQLYQTKLMLAGNASTHQQKVLSATEALNQSLGKASGDFNNFLGPYANAAADIAALKKNPNDSYSQMSLARAYVLARNKGATSENDAKIAFTAFGVADWAKRVESWSKGEKVTLNRNEQAALIHIFQNEAQNQYKKQLSIESQYKNSSNSYNGPGGDGLINWDAMRLPSRQFETIQKTISTAGQPVQKMAPAAAVEDVTKNPQLLPQFIKYYGYDPTKPPPQQQSPGQPPQGQPQQ